MSKPRVSLRAIVDTTAHASTIVDFLSGTLAGRSLFELHSLSQGLDEQGRLNVTFEARLNVQSDRDAIRDAVINRVRDRPQTRDWFLTGTTVTIHLCTHDEPEDLVRPCTETSYSVEFMK